MDSEEENQPISNLYPKKSKQPSRSGVELRSKRNEDRASARPEKRTQNVHATNNGGTSAKRKETGDKNR